MTWPICSQVADEENDAKNSLGVDSTMKYLQELKVNLENAELLVAFDILQVQTVGEITRKGYVDGWMAARYAFSRDFHDWYGQV